MRLPAILQETIDCNRELAAGVLQRISDLKDEISSNGKVQALTAPQPEIGWDKYAAAHVGQHYLDIPWFFLENYVYKRLLDILRPDYPAVDPFHLQKVKSMTAATNGFASTVLPLADAAFHEVLFRSLWGNRADLSLTGGKVHTSAVTTGSTADAIQAQKDEHAALLLCDDSAAVERLLATAAGAPAPCQTGSEAPSMRDREVMIVLDNCGLELLTDLVLVHSLLKHGYATNVTLMCKTSPVFVSDALIYDVHAHIDWIGTALPAALTSAPPATGSASVSPSSATAAAAAVALASSLKRYLSDGRLRLESHPFFTSPLAGWDMPGDLKGRLEGVTLAIVKGDANYRRLLGDRHWPHNSPFADVVAYCPCPLVALRTCKAGLIVGISAEAEARAAGAHPKDWLVSGMYGVVQLKA